MIEVQLGKATAIWDDDETKWFSSDGHFMWLLNATIPEEVNLVEATLLEGGRQGVALKAARKRFGAALKVTKNTPAPVPVESPDEEI